MWSVGEGGGLVARVWEMAGCGLGGRVAFCIVLFVCVWVFVARLARYGWWLCQARTLFFA